MQGSKAFYNRIAPIYDFLLSATFALARFDEEKFRAKMIQKISDLSPDTPILDLGCGTGRNFHLIRSLLGNHKIIGIDISDRMLELAENKANKHGITNIDFIENDVTNSKEIMAKIGGEYAVISSLTLSVIWSNKAAVEGFLSLCANAKCFSIMDGNWRIGIVPFKSNLVKMLSVPFGVASTYWSLDTEEYIARFLRVKPEILFRNMLFVM